MSGESNATRQEQIARYFVVANLEGEPIEILSPSGRYRLLVRTYRTAPGRWNYTRGTVLRTVDATTVCDIQRNLGTFHHSFVTKDAREYLITGRSYMSQTIIDLDRAVEYEPKGDHYDGGAFCWAQCYLSPDGNTLAVDGCIWAWPYEFRFFDFTDPAMGWSAIPIAGVERVEDPSDKTKPRWVDARTFECHQADTESGPQERTRLERRGDQMVIVDHWVSDGEQARRDAEARAEAEQDLWWGTFHTTDPMYLRLVELVRKHKIPGDTLDWQPAARHIVQYFRRESPRASADLHWNLETQSIVVQLYDAAGNCDRKLSFAHSNDGIEAAVEAIASVFRSG